jgi:hypothetical protein
MYFVNFGVTTDAVAEGLETLDFIHILGVSYSKDSCKQTKYLESRVVHSV